MTGDPPRSAPYRGLPGRTWSTVAAPPEPSPQPPPRPQTRRRPNLHRRCSRSSRSTASIATRGTSPRAGSRSKATRARPTPARTARTGLGPAHHRRRRDAAEAKKPQPTKDEKEFVINWIENTLTKVDCTGPQGPRPRHIRRLNRAEYNNTIRDLVRRGLQAAEDFPADDVGYGFDNIGDVLSFPPILLEKYLAAADKILDAAHRRSREPVKSAKQSFRPQNILVIPRERQGTRRPGQQDRLHVEGLGVPGEVQLPGRGRIHDPLPRLGHERRRRVPKVIVRVDGKDVQTFNVEAEQGKPQIYEATAKFKAGEKRRRGRLHQRLRGQGEQEGPRVRLELIEIEGPFDAVPPPDSAS